LRREQINGDVDLGAGPFQEFEDEYLEALYEINERKPGQLVRNGEIAEYLSVTPASATEMVQRLAKNGFVDYIPYKGVLLTEKGLMHGRVMKRRHRLAEVLLSRIPFEGDVHETACRLEHAFNDDLEACISIMLGNPELDPSGRDIPPPSEEVANKISFSGEYVLASNLEIGQSGFIEMIIASPTDLETLSNLGVNQNVEIKRFENGNLVIADQGELSENLAERILLRWSND
jgi:DtxR family Mn-dependent transcriptional regulator